MAMLVNALRAGRHDFRKDHAVKDLAPARQHFRVAEWSTLQFLLKPFSSDFRVAEIKDSIIHACPGDQVLQRVGTWPLQFS